jgi:type II secretory pathway pseudopilin PulG
MGTPQTAGFTILETMLFLAITGLLIVSLLTGVGTSINTQRYRDSVQSLESDIQAQYSNLVNVSNDQNVTVVSQSKNAPWVCNANGTLVDSGNSGAGATRGQSNCVMLGRYMQIDDQGNITVETITGVQTGTATTGTNDIQSLKTNYTLGLSNINTETSQMQWGATLSWPTSGQGAETVQGSPRSIALLFVRSPDSGTIYTFTVDKPAAIDTISSADLLKYIQAGAQVSQGYNGATVRGQDERVLCVQSGSANLGEHMAVYLNPYASDATAVETQSNDLLQSLKSGALRC